MVINEQNQVTLMAENLNQQKPKFITEKLFVGISDQGYPDDPKQFVGSVANLILLEDDGKYDINSDMRTHRKQLAPQRRCLQWLCPSHKRCSKSCPGSSKSNSNSG